MIKYIVAFILFASPCLAGMGIGGFPSPGPGVMPVGAVVPYTDDFNRADGVLGTNWSTVAGYGDLLIFSNVVRPSQYNAFSAKIYTGAEFSDNQYSQVNIIAASSNYVGVGVRMSASGNGYVVACPNGTSCYIQKSTAGSRVNIGGAITTVSTKNKILRLEASESTLNLFVNGIFVGSRTDETYTSGYPLILTGSSNIAYTIDNFEANNL